MLAFTTAGGKYFSKCLLMRITDETGVISFVHKYTMAKKQMEAYCKVHSSPLTMYTDMKRTNTVTQN